MKKTLGVVLSFAIMFQVWAPMAKAQLGHSLPTADFNSLRLARRPICRWQAEVPESVLVRLRDVTATKAWDILQDAGYRISLRVVGK